MNTNESPIILQVVNKRPVAEGVTFFDLRHPSGAELPRFTAGAHIGIRTPNKLVRKYSLCNDPAERHRYCMAIKREEAGRGGSASLVDEAMIGDHLDVWRPANNFELPARAQDLLFIAGGIGITPFMSMIYQLAADSKRFRLIYLCRSPEMTAFKEELQSPKYADRILIHHDFGDASRAFDLGPILAERRNREHLYCCGPTSLMRAVREMTAHWSSAAVHFEAFAEPQRSTPADKPFYLRLSKSNKRLAVPVGATILEVLRSHGLAVASSCETGTCGTCRARLVEGIADHRDLCLSASDRSDSIMMCVSRALSEEITIDL